MEPVAAYELAAPLYAAMAARRRAYRDAVDRLVAAEIPAGSRRMLDVGAGDGSRSRRIAALRGIEELVMLEPSVAMQGARDGEFWSIRAEELHTRQGRFDAITCLWNVLGHVADRAEVLRQFARLLAPEGRVLFDVNHRYNARAYGLLPTMGRFLGDRFAADGASGDVQVRIGENVTRGHFFTDREVRALCAAAGLAIEKRFVVDYETGALRRWSCAGQLLYAARHKR